MCCRTLVIAVSWAFASLVSGPAPAQTSTALTGLVSSAENNAMEGVLPGEQTGTRPAPEGQNYFFSETDYGI